jgi:hypothetical protein
MAMIRVRELARNYKSVRFHNLSHYINHDRLHLHFDVLNKKYFSWNDCDYIEDYR